MTIHRRSRLGTLAVIFVILAALSVKAGTVGQMITALRLEKIWIDQTRFPDSVMFSLMNVELSRLAHEDMAYEKTAIIPLDDTLYDWALPVGTYAVAAVILNVDHNAKASEQVIKALTYVRPQDIGQKFTYGKGRPSQWSIWSDTLRLDQRTTTLMDTLIVRYW